MKGIMATKHARKAVRKIQKRPATKKSIRKNKKPAAMAKRRAPSILKRKQAELPQAHELKGRGTIRIKARPVIPANAGTQKAGPKPTAIFLQHKAVELPSAYEPQSVEDRIYAAWE